MAIPCVFLHPGAQEFVKVHRAPLQRADDGPLFVASRFQKNVFCVSQPCKRREGDHGRSIKYIFL